jgi:hypothetical protein
VPREPPHVAAVSVIRAIHVFIFAQELAPLKHIDELNALLFITAIPSTLLDKKRIRSTKHPSWVRLRSNSVLGGRKVQFTKYIQHPSKTPQAPERVISRASFPA